MACNTPQQDVVSGEQYRYALTNFRIAHEKVEEQRMQLQEQERQVALLRARIALLEGTNQDGQAGAFAMEGSNSVDDFSIKNAASNLGRLMNRWAADIVRALPVPLDQIRDAALKDLLDSDIPEPNPFTSNTTGMQVQGLLRHAMSQTISEGIINCLVITNCPDANIQLTRIHEHIFSRDATVAAVWRRQTFSAAVESCSNEMSRFLLTEHMAALTATLNIEKDKPPASEALNVLQAAYGFSRMLHGSPSSSGGTVDAFYRAFVPELRGTLDPQQIELVKRCIKTEHGQPDRVGATVFPGLVKVSRSAAGPSGQENTQTVVKRAQVVCECALGVNTDAQCSEWY